MEDYQIDLALERTLKAYARDCQQYRQCVKAILEVLEDSPDDDWIVKYIRAQCNTAFYNAEVTEAPKELLEDS